MIRRVLQKTIEDNLEKQKVTVLTGARRVGKTELLKAIKEKHQGQSLWLNGEDADALSLLAEQSVANYRRLLNGVRLLIIDEAHFVPDIMRKAKLMIDEIRPLHIILTSSSAFTLTQSSGALVGRSMSYTLFPLAQMEFNHHENALETKQNLPDRLIYGSYPELLHLETNREKEFYLKELVNTYMLKDILVFENIRNAQKLRDLLELLARQIGHEVSLDELGRQLALSKNTVERYLELIEKVFIIYRRRGFSRNLRKEIAKSKRWYFFDNGIRNAILNDFRGMAQREDKGMLWENYIASERIKRFAYRQEAV
jgi:predicted AAA+ superfamily ATPase